MGIIEFDNVGKCFKKNWVLRNISLSFESGKIYGLLGSNGSGKTMMMKIITGMVTPTEGIVWVEGRRVGIDVDIPDSIGAIIEVPGFLPNLSAFDNLKYLAELRSIISDDTIYETIRVVGLDPYSKKRVGKFSLGMKQRLGVAQAIMEDPNILLLDEPMNGLDSQGVSDVRRLLMEKKATGKTIILASHHMEDIDTLCDCVYKLENGKIIS